MSFEEPIAKKKRRIWSRSEERLLVNIVNNYDGGSLKNVIVEYKTNVKMNRHDAWEIVT